MSPRATSWLAWSLLASAALFLLAGLYFWSPGTESILVPALLAALFGSVGALIASRRPENPIGWLFLSFALVAAIAGFADAYAYRTLVERPGSLPAGDWVAWVGGGVWHPAFGFFVFAFLLFPNGRLPSARWRPVAWVAAANYLVGAVLGLLWGPLSGELFPYANPPFRLPGYSIASQVFWVFILVNFGLLALSAFSLVLRLRRATGVERQQLKWFVYAVALFALVFPPSVFVIGNGALIGLLLPLVPVSAGIAILRYRLYDIDLIVNRTLVYGALSATLVAAYLGIVTVTQSVLQSLTDQQGLPQLAVVVSTLAIAALFNPLRRRVQAAIDRLFYRSKYDARRVLEAFSLRLRDETDLDSLDTEVVSVVRDTLRPAHASLWLREPAGVARKEPRA